MRTRLLSVGLVNQIRTVTSMWETISSSTLTPSTAPLEMLKVSPSSLLLYHLPSSDLPCLFLSLCLSTSSLNFASGHTQRPFVDSSPSNGIISSDPYVKQWGTASTPKAGDTHFYDYSSDCESYSMYPDSKFISEFGFQVHPSYLAYEPVTTTEDRSKSSKFVQYRQRHEDGNNQMEYQITRHFTLPMMGDDGCDEEEVSRRGGGWDSYLYLSQIQQSRCYETAINYWRSLRSDLSGGNIPQTMGVLYWQLNDIWEGPSWASMEWGGRWKPLQYSVKRSFAEISLSFLGLPQEDEVKVFGINDRLVDSPVGYSLYLFPWTLSTAAASSASVSVSSLPDSLEEYLVLSSKATLLAGSSQELEKLSLSSLFATLPALNCSRSTCFLYLKAEQVSSAATSASASMAVPSVSYFPEPFKNLKWTQKPTILTTHFQHISPTTIQFVLEVDMISPFLFMELTGSNVLVENPSGKGVNNVNAGWFSDNNFLALPGVKYEIRYTSFEEISLEMDEWKEKLQIRSLQSVQTESCA
jgi:beta-mannosidase